MARLLWHSSGGQTISFRKKTWFAYALLLLTALSFRLFVALRLPNDAPDDGRVYAQIARNVLEQHVYSHESERPYVPSLIRLPGYPLFLAAVYSVFGHGNNAAVRVVQALIDAATCVLIALVAFKWAPGQKRKHAAALAALGLAAVCPFTAIYSATILTEVPTSFFAVAMVLVATLAFEVVNRKRAFLLWAVTGLIAGLAVLFRPDSGLFAAAIGITIVISAFERSGPEKKPQLSARRFWRAVPSAAIFSVAFLLVLVPWTIRNRRVFHLFQPLSPTHGEMPGEFVPHGYLLWLRTWISDGRYVGPVLWALDSAPLSIDKFPDEAFDSEQERDRVAALLEKYNHPPEQQDTSASTSPSVSHSGPESVPPQTATPVPGPSEEPSSNEEESQQDEGETSEDEEATSPEEFSGEMTPAVDAGFAEIGRERVARARMRYYVILPMKRAVSLWFDTHSQYYPFEGELLPLEDLDYQIHQHLWLPLFAGSTWIYSILGAVGAGLLWRSRESANRRWVILAGLIIFLRLGFFATLENPEPRYTVEIFPFLAILGGVAVSQILAWRRARSELAKPAFD
jgi:hypothetical protein